MLLIWARLNRRLRPQAFAALAIALVALDLFRAGVGLNPAIPLAHAKQPPTGAIRYLQSRRPDRFAGIGSGPVPSIGLTMFPYGAAVRYGLYDARGYDTPMIGRYQRYWSRTIVPVYYLFASVPKLTERSLRGLNLLSVADIVQPKPDSPPLRLLGLKLAYKGVDAQVYSNAKSSARLPGRGTADRG